MIRIAFDEDRRAFRPRERISGAVEWERSRPPGSLEIRLFWHTEGQATSEHHVIEQQQIAAFTDSGRESFSFNLPEMPYSFSGKIVSVLWEIEVELSDGGQVALEQITVSPTGEVIRLARQ